MSSNPERVPGNVLMATCGTLQAALFVAVPSVRLCISALSTVSTASKPTPSGVQSVNAEVRRC